MNWKNGVELDMKRFLKSGWFIFGTIIVLFFGYFWAMGFNIDGFSSMTADKKGLFGDSFGALTALFSALAFGAFVITLWQQQEDLELTRTELKRSADALREQSKNLQRQNFENTFFNMLNLQNDITDKLSTHLFKIHSPGNFPLPYKVWDSFEKTVPSFVTFYHNEEEHIGYVLNNLFEIMKYVDQGNIENKKFYMDVLKVQFSSNILLLIFFYGFSEYSRSHFKQLLEKYGFFEYLRYQESSEIDRLLLSYDKSVYGSNENLVNIIQKIKNENIDNS